MARRPRQPRLSLVRYGAPIALARATADDLSPWNVLAYEVELKGRVARDDRWRTTIEAGLLDAEPVTLHWEAQSAFTERYPTLPVTGGNSLVELAHVGAQGGLDGLVAQARLLVREDPLLLGLDVRHGQDFVSQGMRGAPTADATRQSSKGPARPPIAWTPPLSAPCRRRDGVRVGR